MPDCLIALGANLGDRDAALAAAVGRLRGTAGLAVTAVSGFHRTAPVGGPAGQGEFLNAAVRATTTLPPEGVLAVLLDAEQAAGRTRRRRWEARAVDLDLLLYGDAVLAGPGLTVPHPRMAVRRFVLAPAAEVAADLMHPLLGRTVGDLLAQLDRADDVLAVVAEGDAHGESGGGSVAEALVEAVAARLEADGHVIETAARPEGWTDGDWARLRVPGGGTLLVAGRPPQSPVQGPRAKVLVTVRTSPAGPTDTGPPRPRPGEEADPAAPIGMTIGPADGETLRSEIAAAALAMR